MIEGQEGVTWEDWARPAHLAEKHVGAGWYEREHVEHGFPFLDAKQRFQLFAEHVEIVVRSWTEAAFDHEQMLDERRETWLAGTVEEVTERIAKLEALGVTRVFLQHLNHSDDAMLALMGDRLLPALA